MKTYNLEFNQTNSNDIFLIVFIKIAIKIYSLLETKNSI